MEEEKTKVRAVLRRIFPDVVVDDALVSVSLFYPWLILIIMNLVVRAIQYCTLHGQVWGGLSGKLHNGMIFFFSFFFLVYW